MNKNNGSKVIYDIRVINKVNKTALPLQFKAFLKCQTFVIAVGILHR